MNNLEIINYIKNIFENQFDSILYDDREGEAVEYPVFKELMINSLIVNLKFSSRFKDYYLNLEIFNSQEIKKIKKYLYIQENDKDIESVNIITDVKHLINQNSLEKFQNQNDEVISKIKLNKFYFLIKQKLKTKYKSLYESLKKYEKELRQPIIYIKIKDLIVAVYYKSHNILFLYTNFINILKNKDDFKIVINNIYSILKQHIKKIEFTLDDITIGTDVEFELYDKVFKEVIKPIRHKNFILVFENDMKKYDYYIYSSQVNKLFSSSLSNPIGLDGSREVMEFRTDYSNDINKIIKNFSNLLKEFRNSFPNFDLILNGNDYSIGSHIHLSCPRLNFLIATFNAEVDYFKPTKKWKTSFEISVFQEIYYTTICLIDNKIGMFMRLSGQARKETNYYARRTFRFNYNFGTIEYRSLPSIIFADKKMLKIIFKLCQNALFYVIKRLYKYILFYGMKIRSVEKEVFKKYYSEIRLKELLTEKEIMYLIEKRKEMKEKMKNYNNQPFSLLAAWKINNTRKNESESTFLSESHRWPIFGDIEDYDISVIFKNYLYKSLKDKYIYIFRIPSLYSIKEKTYNIKLDGFEKIDKQKLRGDFEIVEKIYLLGLSDKIFVIGLPPSILKLGKKFDYLDSKTLEKRKSIQEEYNAVLEKIEKVVKAIDQAYENFINKNN